MKKRKNRKQADIPETFVAAVIPTENYIVLRDGRPCMLINVSGLHKGGVLNMGMPVVTFAKHRDAERAIERTQMAREKLLGSLVEKFFRTQVPSFLEGQKFEVVPAGHQNGDPRLAKPAVTKHELEESRMAAAAL